MHTKLCLEDLQGRDHSEDLGANGRIIIMNLMEIVWEDVDWIHLAKDRDQ
jgi:hypothetical protein